MHSTALFESRTGTDPITKHALWLAFIPCLPLAIVLWYKGQPAAAVISITCILLIVGLAYLGALAISYTATGNTLTIKGVGTKFDIASSDLADAKIIELQPAWRTFGIGGINCYQGRFYNKQLGDFELYARTYQGPAVLLTLHNGRRIVITPTQPLEVLQALQHLP